MATIFTRRQIETTLAALLAAVTAIVGLAGRDDARIGPKFLALERVGRFVEPIHLSQPPGSDLLYVVERPGRVRVIDGERVRRQPFLDIRGRVEDRGKGGERGLLSIAFAPKYPKSGLFYVAYTDHRGGLRIVEYRREDDSGLTADPGSARLVLRIRQPTPKHHGGLVLFGPEGRLYIGSGDGGPSGDPRGVAQDKDSLLGKILRIDPRRRGRKPYTLPPDNPYVGRPGRDELFAYGVRNPWRFSFDRATGVFTLGDVGDERFEEIDILPARKLKGANFGWNAYEGFAPFRGGVPRSRTVQPVLAYPHDPACAVTGGFVVRDPRLSRIAGREVIGRYLFGDYCTGRIFAFRFGPGMRGKERRLRFRVPSLSSFGEDRAGRIYFLSQRGPVYRLDPRRKRE